MNRPKMCVSIQLLIALFIVTTVKADLIISNGVIHTLNPDQPTAEAVVVSGDRIVFVGGLKAARTYTNSKHTKIDLSGRTLTPGLIESHGHIMGLGYSKMSLNLMDAVNYKDLVSRVEQAVQSAEPGDWIVGRGWHQSKWVPQPEMIRGFQTHEELSAVSPNNPVYLVHASGHAAMANSKAMEIAGINAESEFSGDGEIIKDDKLNPTGIFNEIAQSLIARHIPPPDQNQREQALSLALAETAKFGITSFQDAGSGKQDVLLYKQFLADKRLTSRLWVMLSGRDQELLLDAFRTGPEIGLGDNFLTIRAVKLVADGALGSRGAWLLEGYSDRQDHFGLPTMPVQYLTDISTRAFNARFQIGVHAIGDRANREVLDVFERLFEGKDQGVRFRIEHAQHISETDIPRFARLGVVASVQGIHLSSDRPWAIKRLGKERIEESAYVWRKLLDSGARLINGTDVPVEPINPIASFYSLVTRQTLAGEPEGGFEPDQKLTRLEALRSYTLDAAYGAFEDKIKGTIEPGKLADFTVFSQDILTVADKQLLDTQVEMTIVGGEVVFSSK